MKKLLIFIIVCMSSCVVPYSSYDYDALRYDYHSYPYYQPTRIIIKHKPHKPHKHHKRHIRVKINKPRK